MVNLLLFGFLRLAIFMGLVAELTQPLLAQPPFQVSSCQFFPGPISDEAIRNGVPPNLVASLVADCTFQSAGPILGLTATFGGPVAVTASGPTPGSSTNGPNSQRVVAFLPVQVPTSTPGNYALTGISATNALGQTLQAPPAALPQAGFVVAPPPPPFTLTSFSASQFNSSDNGSGFVFFTLTFTTGASLSSACSLSVAPPSGSVISVPITQNSLISTTANASGRLEVSASNPSGLYQVTNLTCSNTGSQSLNLAAADFPGGAPPPITVVRCPLPPAPNPGGPDDKEGPILTCLAVFPASRSASQSPVSFTFALGLTDNLSGVGLTRIEVRSPRGLKYGGALGYSMVRLNHTGVAAVEIPRYAEAGVYEISVITQDLNGNERTYTGSGLTSLGFSPTVSIQAGTQDVTPPVISSVRVLNSIVNVSAEDQVVTLQFSASDALSGIVPLSASVNIALPGFYDTVRFGTATLVSGTTSNGVINFEIYMRRLSTAGNVQIKSISLKDAAGNEAVLSGLETSTGFTVLSVPSDAQRPQLDAYSFTPWNIDTAAASQNLVFTVSWSDDVSGFLPGLSENFTLALRAPSGRLVRPRASCVVRAAGDPKFLYPRYTTYACTVTLPRYSEFGTWTVEGVGVVDGVGYGPGPFGANLDTAFLQSRGFRTQFVNGSPSPVPDGFIGPGGGTVTAATNPLLTLSALPNVFASSTAVRFQQTLPGSLIPIPQGFSASVSDLITLSFSPALSRSLLSPGFTMTVPLLSPLPTGSVLALYRLDPVSGAATPVPSAFGGTVTGVLSPAGNVATFAGLTTANAFIAFRRNSEVVGDVDGNGAVDCGDVGLVRAALGRRIGQVAFDSRTDLNRDGVVDIRDLGIVTRQLPLGTVCP